MEPVAVVPVVAFRVVDGHLIGVVYLGQGGGLWSAGAEPLSYLLPSGAGELQGVVQQHRVESGLVVPGASQDGGWLARIGSGNAQRITLRDLNIQASIGSTSPGITVGGAQTADVTVTRNWVVTLDNTITVNEAAVGTVLSDNVFRTDATSGAFGLDGVLLKDPSAPCSPTTPSTSRSNCAAACCGCRAARPPSGRSSATLRSGAPCWCLR